jgi:hypothetical protein
MIRWNYFQKPMVGCGGAGLATQRTSRSESPEFSQIETVWLQASFQFVEVYDWYGADCGLLGVRAGVNR